MYNKLRVRDWKRDWKRAHTLPLTPCKFSVPLSVSNKRILLFALLLQKTNHLYQERLYHAGVPESTGKHLAA